MSIARGLGRHTALPLLITVVLWIVVDGAVTYFSGVRGFSLFYVSDQAAGHINKPNFSGRFGGFLDAFSNIVNIGPLGERKSSPAKCKGVPFVLFMGDSTTAGFEVGDDETFVSQINRNCSLSHIAGENFGVRATDTHEVLGNYKRVAKLIKHKAVLYLISDNDLSENMRLYHYINITKHFGRVYNEKFYLAPSSSAERIYLKFRIFVSDHFYTTTKLIEMIEKIRSRVEGNSVPITVNGKVSSDQASTLIKLIDKLSNAANDNNARLYVAVYPCFYDSGCDYVQEIEHIVNSASEKTKTFDVLPLVRILNEKFARHEIKKEDMRFYNDSHLSKYGHKIVADELARLLADKLQSSLGDAEPAK